MKKLIQRFLMFIIGLPLTVIIVVALPQKHHLVANITVILLSALGAVEFAELLKQKNNVISLAEAAILGALSPLAMTLAVSFGLHGEVIPAAFILGAAWVLVSRVFVQEDKLRDVTGRAAAGFAVMMYPGLFMAWIIRMALLDHADMVILMFLFMVIANDSTAWAAGLLFGKGNQGIIPVSPNKSVAGFIGGFVASVLVGLGAVLLVPEVFSSRRLPTIYAGIILGCISGIAAGLGDLGESAMKRSVQVKDSGSIIPGRGGVLDTIDSICLAAPVYYASYWFLFGL
ncbi:MAG: phosphatidate cytidylyltransferase [Treponema sp.]|jgi:phosphatidate cytidylyltransferase|nr:phosphatidate cytidylyltransferase [Treponema sp.]